MQGRAEIASAWEEIEMGIAYGHERAVGWDWIVGWVWIDAGFC